MMQKTSRKTEGKKENKDEKAKKQDEKLKRSLYTISTPRSFVQKSTTSDIYAQKKKSNVQNVKAPKKVIGVTHTSNESPTKSYLSSSASSVSQLSKKDASPKSIDAISSISKKIETPKKPLMTNVTVNSPAAKRRLNLNTENVLRKEVSALNLKSTSGKGKETGKLSRQASNLSITAKDGRKERTNDGKGERQRTKTRTLDENEVKILKTDVVDNNASMMRLSQKLAAKPKAFYVNLDENQAKETGSSQRKKDKSSDEDISYEDDFESYESDFDSYHSDQTDPDEKSGTSDRSETTDKSEAREQNERNEETPSVEESSLKEKDEEKMLDSGNFDLREQRSAKSKPVGLEFILEDSEDRKTVSLTDEGFQDMSSSSAVFSLKTQQSDRPLFIDITKSKQSKQKRKIHERLQQRAKDLLGMITLHEMSYSLFEMQPISYDLYMATFGRSNYTQIGVQTFDDGINEEIQTDEVAVSQKWTQHPVEFSKSDIYRSKDISSRKYSKHTEDYLTKFTFMMKANVDDQGMKMINSDENYKTNPLRVFLEQKDGAGSDEMLSYDAYKTKLQSNNYNTTRLGKFLKKFESTVNHVLSSNVGHKDMTNLSKSNKIPFSKGFFSLSTQTGDEKDEKCSMIKYSKISHVIFSETKANLILTIHKKVKNISEKKSLICLWDLSVASAEPIKFLTAIDDVGIGRFRGNVTGMFVAALDDGSLHLWDLSEEPTWRNEVSSEKTRTDIVEIDSSKMTEVEKDREWNVKNSQVGFDQAKSCQAIALQSCAFTSSGGNLMTKDEVDRIVGLEMNTELGNMEAGKRLLGQILSLQRIGILTIWSIIQDKIKNSQDIGKAFLSKIKLEKCQTIKLSEHIDMTHSINSEKISSFNLNSAKRRLSLKKKEKCLVKSQKSRPQTAISSKFDFDIDRPSSAASLRKKVLPVEINLPKNWETGVVCNDLKIMRIDNVDNYLIAKNCGEVLCCKRCLGAVRIQRFSVATDISSVTNLEVSTQGLPYFLAATDTGCVNLCSLLDKRVLLTLDCRNVPTSHNVDKCMSDSKGKFISSMTTRRPAESIEKPLSKLVIKSVHWSPVNPCSVHVLLQDCTVVLFELTHSDIYAKYVCENAAVQCSANNFHLALLTTDGEVQIHRLLTNESETKENLNIFKKYVALL